MRKVESEVNILDDGKIEITTTRTTVEVDKAVFSSLVKAPQEIGSHRIWSRILEWSLYGALAIDGVMGLEDLLHTIRASTLDDTNYGTTILFGLLAYQFSHIMRRLAKETNIQEQALENFNQKLITNHQAPHLQSSNNQQVLPEVVSGSDTTNPSDN